MRRFLETDGYHVGHVICTAGSTTKAPLTQIADLSSPGVLTGHGRTSGAPAAPGACSIGWAGRRRPPARSGPRPGGCSPAARCRRAAAWSGAARPPRRRAGPGLPDRAEVLQGAQHVVVPAGRKRELQPGRVDDLAGALAPEQPPLEQVLLAPAARGDGSAEPPGRPLVRQQPFEHVDRRVRTTTARSRTPPSSSTRRPRAARRAAARRRRRRPGRSTRRARPSCR